MHVAAAGAAFAGKLTEELDGHAALYARMVCAQRRRLSLSHLQAELAGAEGINAAGPTQR